ncbi:MAG: hypothetical protein ACLR8P_11615 [Clostridium fessum]
MRTYLRPIAFAIERAIEVLPVPWSHHKKGSAGALLRQDADCRGFQHALFDLSRP